MWVDKNSQPGEDQIDSLLFDMQSNENSRFKIFKVPEAKSISLNDFDEVICGLKFCVWVGKFKCINDLIRIPLKGPKNGLEDRIDRRNGIFNESKEMLSLFLLEMKE